LGEAKFSSDKYGWILLIRHKKGENAWPVPQMLLTAGALQRLAHKH
jgi:hypothetical protein